jgi:hypothetical protein
LYFTKIDKTAQDENNIKKCFNNTWYKACEGKVLLLQEANESDTDVLKVIGSDNDWKITDQGKVLENAGCNPEGNKWIIVKVTTLQEDSKSAGDSFIFYVDDIKDASRFGVFDNIKCYSIEIIAANTSAAQNMWGVFFCVKSALEQDNEKDTATGLIGLEKLNVENVKNINWIFYNAIHKQATLNQLKKWRFSGNNKVDITNLFSSLVKDLDFSVLNGWNESTNKGAVSFLQLVDSAEKVFVKSNNKNDFNPPRWYDNIKIG